MNLSHIEQHGHSRYVTADTGGELTGYLYMKDVRTLARTVSTTPSQPSAFVD